jgi:hypothetical protein
MEISDRVADAEALGNFTAGVAMGIADALKASGIDATPFIATRLKALEATMLAQALSKRRMDSFQDLAEDFLK